MFPSRPPLGQRALVMGASLAGLLAARVLAEHFAEVLLLERDELPSGPAARKGTPQVLQPHGLLARGLQVIDELLPGTLRALVERGAVAGDLHANVPIIAGGRRLAQGRCGQGGIGVSRLALEAEVRARVLALPNVCARTGVTVIEPVLDGGARRVCSVRIAPLADPARSAETVAGDLVLDCTGRGSRTPAWLAAWGYAPAPEERVQVGIRYVSCHFERLPDQLPDVGALICSATAELPRPAVLIAQEPAEPGGVPRWMVGTGGYAGDHPGDGLEGMHERARQIGCAEILQVLRESKPIGAPMAYHYPHSQRRRYEALKRFPQRYLVAGDAFTSFNPIYGQGMTTAACQAMALRDALRKAPPAGASAALDGLHRRFHRAAARVVDTPWQMAVGADLALPQVQGARPLRVRLVNAYVARVHRAAERDADVALAFRRVIHLLARPESLFAPRVLWRVWRLGGQSPARSRHGWAAQPQRGG